MNINHTLLRISQKEIEYKTVSTHILQYMYKKKNQTDSRYITVYIHMNTHDFNSIKRSHGKDIIMMQYIQ